MSHLRFLALIALIMPVAAQAQDKQKLCQEVQDRAFTQGQWASYKFTGGQLDGGTMRMAVVGQETHEGTPFYWVEMMMGDPKRGAEGRWIMQSLVSALGPNAKGVRSVVMKQGTQPAMRMPQQMVQMMNTSKGMDISREVAQQCQEMTIVGNEDVTVPAGHFQTIHMRHPSNGMDVWVQTSVNFAMVKTTTKDVGTIELTAQGSGAKSSITETPREMTGFPGAPPPR